MRSSVIDRKCGEGIGGSVLIASASAATGGGVAEVAGLPLRGLSGHVNLAWPAGLQDNTIKFHAFADSNNLLHGEFFVGPIDFKTPIEFSVTNPILESLDRTLADVARKNMSTVVTSLVTTEGGLSNKTGATVGGMGAAGGMRGQEEERGYDEVDAAAADKLWLPKVLEDLAKGGCTVEVENYTDANGVKRTNVTARK